MEETLKTRAERAYELLEKLSFTRVSCSEEETRAAGMLKAEAEKNGVPASIETFEASCGVVKEARLKVLEPYEKEYEVTGYIRSDSTPPDGLELDFVYAENGLPQNLVGCEGKAILVNGRVTYRMYERLQKAKPAAIIGFSGGVTDRNEETDLDIRKLRETYAGAFGSNVLLNLRASDALELVARGAKKVRVTVKAESFDGVSRNVLCEIPGTEFPDEIVSFGAHYDSVYFSKGAYDNMSGSVIIMEMLRYFKANPPRRTVRFHWYGSEEQGLLGSKAWTKAHEDELSKHVLMINVDVAAPVLGSEQIITMGTEAMTSYVDGMMKELGKAAEVKTDIYSSDSVPFADKGVPAINFCRFGAHGAAFIHERRDDLAYGYMNAEALGKTLDIVMEFSKRIINAPVFPIERKISDEIKDKVDKYLFRKK